MSSYPSTWILCCLSCRILKLRELPWHDRTNLIAHSALRGRLIDTSSARTPSKKTGGTVGYDFSSSWAVVMVQHRNMMYLRFSHESSPLRKSW